MTVDLTAQIHQYLSTAPGSLFAQQEVTIVDHWQGDANLLWRAQCSGEDAVVKLFLDAGQARSRRQHDGHEHFAPLGLAPQPLWADRYPHGLSRQVIVYRWVDGEVIDPAGPSALLAWAEAIGRLHATTTGNVRRFSPHPVNLDFYWRIEAGSIAQIGEWLKGTDLAISRLFQQTTTAGEQLVHGSLSLWATALPTPVHGDLSREHSLVERGHILFLDWEMFGLGDPALDMARLLQRETQALTAAQRDTFLARYLEVVDLPNQAERIEVMLRLLELHNVLYLLGGLQQHATGTVDETMRAALPFMESALTVAIQRAAQALAPDDAGDVQPVVAEFMAWLGDAT